MCYQKIWWSRPSTITSMSGSAHRTIIMVWLLKWRLVPRNDWVLCTSLWLKPDLCPTRCTRSPLEMLTIPLPTSDVENTVTHLKLLHMYLALANRKGPILHDDVHKHVWQLTWWSWTNWGTKVCLIYHTHQSFRQLIISFLIISITSYTKMMPYKTSPEPQNSIPPV